MSISRIPYLCLSVLGVYLSVNLAQRQGFGAMMKSMADLTSLADLEDLRCTALFIIESRLFILTNGKRKKKQFKMPRSSR